MNDSKDQYRFLGNSEDSPVIPIKDMPIGRSQYFIFWNGRASFRVSLQSGDLLFYSGNELCRFPRTILANKIPNLSQIVLGGPGDLNLVTNGHA